VALQQEPLLLLLLLLLLTRQVVGVGTPPLCQQLLLLRCRIQQQR
jgi:hypothetical protein